MSVISISYNISEMGKYLTIDQLTNIEKQCIQQGLGLLIKKKEGLEVIRY